MKQIPLHSIVVLVGPSQGGKTTWARQNFPEWEIVSADQIKLELQGDSLCTSTIPQVWDELYRRVEVQVHMGQRAVVDSSNLKPRDRQRFAELATKLGVEIFYVPIDRPLEVKKQGIVDNDQLDQVVRTHSLWQSSQKEFFKGDGQGVIATPDSHVVPFPSRSWQPTQILAVGDVHGNYPAMMKAVELAQSRDLKIVWLGDVVDYGSANLKCFKLAYDTVRSGQAAMIWGNHERKVERWIQSNWGQSYSGKLSEATKITVTEIGSISRERRLRFETAWHALKSWSWQHVVLNNWMFTHGAATPEMWTLTARRLSGKSGNHAFFGEVDNQTPTKQDGYPNRVWNWVNDVPQDHRVVVGHDWLDRALHQITVKSNSIGGKVFCIDCGSSKGGRLAALQINTETDENEMHYFD